MLQDTPYDGLEYSIALTARLCPRALALLLLTCALQFPASYPYKPPVIKFTSKIYRESDLSQHTTRRAHRAAADPNVDMHGNICLDILKEKWAPTLSVSTILISLQSLLGGASSSRSCAVCHADNMCTQTRTMRALSISRRASCGRTKKLCALTLAICTRLTTDNAGAVQARGPAPLHASGCRVGAFVAYDDDDGDL